MPAVIAETGRLLIRTLDDSDFEIVCELFKEWKSYSTAKNDKDFQKLLLTSQWKEVKRETTFNGLIFLKGTNQFCGRVCMQHTDEPVPELGIDILSKYQNHGIGPEAIIAFANTYCIEHHIQQVNVRIRNDNEHSIHVFEKLGVKYDGFFPYYPAEVLETIKRELPGKDISRLEEFTVQSYHFDVPIGKQFG